VDSNAWRAWRTEREARLRASDGWLAITAIHWLSATPQQYADVPGSWAGVEIAADDSDGPADSPGAAACVTVTLVAGERLGDLEPGTHELGPLDETGVLLTFPGGVAEVAARPGGPIVRPRRPDAANLRAYVETPSYPADPAWVRAASYADGFVVFPHAGGEHRLRAEVEPDGRLWVLFRDATSGVTTYAAMRQLVLPPPGPDGSTEIDFNRAMNMPCAYTDFATCPVPPPENTLPFAVEAGELIPEFARL
jgi:uncharacterized protein (DUF1684 family)